MNTGISRNRLIPCANGGAGELVDHVTINANGTTTSVVDIDAVTCN